MIKETFDFKRILLGKNYDELNPIKNILMAKKDEYYMDQKSDYLDPNDKWLCRGHIENYLEVDKIFKIAFKDIPKDYTKFDIMNSFWITYKQLLQLSYPMYFCPEGSLSSDFPLVPPKKEIKTLKFDFRSYPPFDSSEYETIHKKHVEYFRKYYSDLKVYPGMTWVQFLIDNFDKFSKVHELSELNRYAVLTHTIGNIALVGDLKVYPGMTWVQFLIDNFDKFSKVHELSELNRYAVLTHTIGNIALVGKGHNSKRSKYLYDYWDLYLKKYVKDTLSFNEWKNFVDQQLLNEYVNKDYEILPFWENRKISDFKDESEILPDTLSFNEWKNFVDQQLLNEYVNKDYEILPFWENRKISDFKDESEILPSEILPKEEAAIIQFLNKVNSYIEKRSERIMNQFNDSKEVI